MEKLETYLAQFPDNATSWREATDEVRDLARKVRTTYNHLALDLTIVEVEAGAGIQPLPFRSFISPAEWNQKAKAQIREVFALLPENLQSEILKDL